MLIAGMSVLTMLTAPAANAQYSGGYTNYAGGYMPYTGSYQWWWMAQSLMYPFSRYGGGSGFNATYLPMYTATSMLTGAGYVASRVAAARQRQKYMNANDPEGDEQQDPATSVRGSNRDEQAATDQVVQAKRMPSNDEQSFAPPVAPDRHARRARKRASNWQSNSPLSQGFIDLVNTRYGGDISKALSDPQTRSFAKAIGVINDDKFESNLSEEKIRTIRNILSDNSEEPSVRVNAVHMMLKD